jgi:sec-independent protein translocase protein TatA
MAFLGPWEIGLILVVILLLFGGRKLPELARSVGDAVKQFRKATDSPLEEPQKEGEVTDQEKKNIVETAKKMGIDVEGRSLKDISKDILEKTEETKS